MARLTRSIRKDFDRAHDGYPSARSEYAGYVTWLCTIGTVLALLIIGIVFRIKPLATTMFCILAIAAMGATGIILYVKLQVSVLTRASPRERLRWALLIICILLGISAILSSVPSVAIVWLIFTAVLVIETAISICRWISSVATDKIKGIKGRRQWDDVI